MKIVVWQNGSVYITSHAWLNLNDSSREATLLILRRHITCYYLINIRKTPTTPDVKENNLQLTNGDIRTSPPKKHSETDTLATAVRSNIYLHDSPESFLPLVSIRFVFRSNRVHHLPIGGWSINDKGCGNIYSRLSWY